ncbi:GNAT family N-acetyltransferase [Cyclobacterium plantarum]|uniref:GNAT family N-acetyltransferase n=1 Tax=Cyclobacterium plantarum TaxID=2716263 RepID=A0ABX0HFD8_9BACT|nr:GNAT family N-acetyltransferase [Cyclobacterium plantarum]NHE59678.1 GNAT family N-acetyltransferase [Cyclobacterium plantarum]
MNLIKANTNNLTTLWAAGGQLAGQYIEESGYRLSIAGSGEWPNKLWFTQPMDMQAIMDIQLNWNLPKLSLPVWGNDLRRQELMLKAHGFEEKLTQVAMSMNLKDAPDHAERVIIQKVTSKPIAEIWSQLFQEAFGYEISADTVSRTMGSIEYFVGKHNGTLVGTAVLFIDQEGVAGIHSMGIIPSQRRKGYAEELLIHMMNIARLKGAAYATLQASDMGKGLYFKIGFQQDFSIKTFIKPKN